MCEKCIVFLKSPEVSLTYETYRNCFRKYKISFGYPRSDTCNACDKFLAHIRSLEKDLSPSSQIKKKKLIANNELLKRKAQAFYPKKRQAKNKSKDDIFFEAIALDYQKNISLPNVTTNDVYYRRQLIMYSFNIHIFSSGKSVFYTYPEITGRKGSNEVVSFLYDFIFNILDARERNFLRLCRWAEQESNSV